MKSLDSTPYFEHHARSIAFKDLTQKDPRELEPFVQALKGARHLSEGAGHQRVLDLGCGSGLDLSQFQKAGIEAVGVEAASGLAQISRVQNPQCEIWQKNFLFLNLKEGEWDGIWANRSLHYHSPEAVQRVVINAFKGLKPRGILGLVIYLGDQAFEDRGADASGPSRHIRPYTENAICSMVEQSGFVIDQVGRQVMRDEHPLPSLLLIARKVN